MATGPASSNVILYGTDEPPAPIRRFALGPLAFDLEAGKLRYIRLDGHEALRAIAFVVRGPSWESPAPKISGFESDERDGRLRIRYRAHYETAGGRLEVVATIDAERDGGIVFEARAQALTDFTTARTSFCILHPIDGIAGQEFDLTRPGETVDKVRFPDAISAHQPFKNIRGISHRVTEGIRASIRMEGDIWEMEDQRNWTDASFKTYGRPRDIPWPYTIPKGDTVVQRAILTFKKEVGTKTLAPAQETTVDLRKARIGRLPRLSLALAAQDLTKPAAALPAFAKCPIGLVVWYEHGVHGEAELSQYAEWSRKLDAEVTVELVLPCAAPLEKELAEAATLMREAGLTPANLLPIQAPMTRWQLKPPEELGIPGFAAVYAAARAAFPGAAIGAGVTSNFTELNIDRPDLGNADFVTHCTAAVIHEPDDRSVMETLETLPHIFRSVREFAGDLPYRLGPSSIGMRYNPYGASTDPNPGNSRVAFARQDPRQRGLFGAAFALGYLARATAAGIDSVCFGAPTGPFGLIHTKADYPQPWFDDQAGSTVYPVYHPVMAIAAANGAPALEVVSSEPKRVLALAYEQDGRRIALWLANLTAEPQPVRLSGELSSSSVLRCLDTAQFETATLDPARFEAASQPLLDRSLTLGPYALAHIVG
jgi:hypothetical protein